jgi:prevent-host-death family protein
MREIQASHAKAHLPQLLDDVERGETLIITRHGRAIARIVPEVDRGRKKSTERWRVSSNFEIEPAELLLKRSGPHARKDGSTDAVRARYIGSGLLDVSG